MEPAALKKKKRRVAIGRGRGRQDLRLVRVLWKSTAPCKNGPGLIQCAFARGSVVAALCTFERVKMLVRLWNGAIGVELVPLLHSHSLVTEACANAHVALCNPRHRGLFKLTVLCITLPASALTVQPATRPLSAEASYQEMSVCEAPVGAGRIYCK